MVKKPIRQTLNLIGDILLFAAAVMFILTFGPVVKEEVKYTTHQVFKVKDAAEKPLTPPNKDFSIVIPKIGAAAPVVSDVDSQDPKVYPAALRKGVAHAKGTPYPGHFGNTYIFAHSTDAFYNVGRYNAVFYLLGKLSPGDEIDIYYKEVLYKYSVTDIKIVEAKDVTYLGNFGEGNTLTLQTCYPPGTTLKRLVVIGRLTNP